MSQFEELLGVAERLNGPGGCPWDQSQNFFSLQPYVLEEAHEVIEAVDTGDDQKIAEELGDLFYTVIFYCKLAAKEGRFSIWDVIGKVKEKLIRRHPHVFGEMQVEGMDEVLRNWEKIKKEEKGHEMRKSVWDGIPKNLPSLARAQKVLQKMKRVNSEYVEKETKHTEEEIAKMLMDVVKIAEASGVDAESALRRYEEKSLHNF